ncbi:MAG TPA: hypothetical protein VN721_09250 [Flavipsychrobacter sp.]|nr:hypothetical protein [Flavipsychrobacter sp.]
MSHKTILAIICLWFTTYAASAQRLSIADSTRNDSLHMLNKIRIKTNRTGMIVLGTWGIGNIVAGTAGYFSAKEKQYKYFGEMNVAWGVINTAIAGLGFAGTIREMNQNLSGNDIYRRYKSTKRLYLINAGLDIVYMGIGGILIRHSDAVSSSDNPARWRGYGKSIFMQGAFLFIFDNVMYAEHTKNNKKWYRLAQGMSVGYKSVGFNYRF